MFGRGHALVYEQPIPERKLEPYATVKRVGLFKWRVGIERGDDDPLFRQYSYHSSRDPIKYFTRWYYYHSEAKAERKAKILLAKAKDRINWDRSVKRFDVK